MSQISMTERIYLQADIPQVKQNIYTAVVAARDQILIMLIWPIDWFSAVFTPSTKEYAGFSMFDELNNLNFD